MELVDLNTRREALTDGARAELVEALKELTKQAEDGEFDGIVWVAVGGDFVFYGGANVEVDFYRLLGGMDALKQQMLGSIYDESN